MFKSTLLFIEATLRTKGGLPKPFYQETQPQTNTSVNSSEYSTTEYRLLPLSSPSQFPWKFENRLNIKLKKNLELIILSSYTTSVYNVFSELRSCYIRNLKYTTKSKPSPMLNMLKQMNGVSESSDCQASPEAPVASYVYCVPALEPYSNTNL